MHDLASLAVPCLAWTRLRPNKVRARRGAGPGGPRRPAMGSSGAHRFDGAAVTWRSMGWRRRVVGARACHRRCRVIRPKFTDTGTSSALMHARGRGRLGRSSPPSPFRGARPCPRAARGCPPAPARLERVRHHIGGSFPSIPFVATVFSPTRRTTSPSRPPSLRQTTKTLRLPSLGFL